MNRRRSKRFARALAVSGAAAALVAGSVAVAGPAQARATDCTRYLGTVGYPDADSNPPLHWACATGEFNPAQCTADLQAAGVPQFDAYIACQLAHEGVG